MIFSTEYLSTQSDTINTQSTRHDVPLSSPITSSQLDETFDIRIKLNPSIVRHIDETTRLFSDTELPTQSKSEATVSFLPANEFINISEIQDEDHIPEVSESTPIISIPEEDAGENKGARNRKERIIPIQLEGRPNVSVSQAVEIEELETIYPEENVVPVAGNQISDDSSKEMNYPRLDDVPWIVKPLEGQPKDMINEYASVEMVSPTERSKRHSIIVCPDFSPVLVGEEVTPITDVRSSKAIVRTTSTLVSKCDENQSVSVEQEEDSTLTNQSISLKNIEQSTISVKPKKKLKKPLVDDTSHSEQTESEINPTASQSVDIEEIVDLKSFCVDSEKLQKTAFQIKPKENTESVEIKFKPKTKSKKKKGESSKNMQQENNEAFRRHFSSDSFPIIMPAEVDLSCGL